MPRIWLLVPIAAFLCAANCDNPTLEPGGSGGGAGTAAGGSGNTGGSGPGGSGGTTSTGGSGGSAEPGGSGGGGSGPVVGCDGAETLALPSSAQHAIGPDGLCLAMDLAAGADLDVKIPTGGSAGAMTLRAPDGEVVWSRPYRMGGSDRILLEVVDAGRYLLELTNTLGNTTTVDVDAALVSATPLAVGTSVTFTSTVAERKLFVIHPAQPGDLFAVQYELPKPGGTAGVLIHPLQAKVQLGTSGIRALAYRSNVHHHPIVEAYRTSGDETEMITLSAIVPLPFPFGADVAVSAPPPGQLVVLSFDGVKDTLYTKGAESDPHGKDRPASTIYAPSGAGAEVPAGQTIHVLTLKETGPYTVEVSNPLGGVGGGSETFRLNPVPDPEPIVATQSPTEAGALALGQVKRYGLAVEAGRIMRLVISSPDALDFEALLEGGKAWEPRATLMGPVDPRVAPGGAFIVQKSEPAILSVYSDSSYDGQATGAYEVKLLDPEPSPASLGQKITGVLPAFGMSLYHVDVQAGRHLLQWSYEGELLGNDTPRVNFHVFAPMAPFQDYGGDLGTGGAYQGSANETTAVLRAGTNTLAVTSDLPVDAPFTATLVALGEPTTIAPGGAAQDGALQPYGRDFHVFAGTATRGFTLRVSAAFDGKVFVHPLDPSGDPTLRGITVTKPFPAALSPTEQALAFTTALTKDYVIEIDGTDDAAGTYTVKLDSP